MATKKEVWLDDRYNEHEREVEALFADLENAICDDDKSRLVAAIDALHEYAHRGDAKVETGIKLRVGGVYITRDGRNTIEIFRQADGALAVADGFSFAGRVIAGSDKKGETYYYSASGAFNPSNPHPDPDDLTHAVIRADRGTVLPEGVPPELDDWVKRWDWITAKVSVDAIRELRKGDEVRIGLNWYTIVRVYHHGRVTRLAFAAVSGDVVPAVADELAAIANEVRYSDR